MRGMWTIVSVLAVANLFALGSFAGWLAASGRLDRERLHELQNLLGESPEQREQRLQEERAELEQAKADAQRLQERVRTLTTAPLTAEQLVEMQQQAVLQSDQRTARATRELEDLRGLLDRERAEVDRLNQRIAEQKEAFERRIAARERLVGEAQFQTAVETLQAMRAPAATNMLSAIWQGQVRSPHQQADGKLVVVEYLRAMENRQRTKILAEFEQQDPTLAAELLERLRTDGVEPEVADAVAGQQPDNPADPP